MPKCSALSTAFSKAAARARDRKLFEEVQRELAERKKAEETLLQSNRFLEIANLHTQMLPLLNELVRATRDFMAVLPSDPLVHRGRRRILQADEGFSQRSMSRAALSRSIRPMHVIDVTQGDTHRGSRSTRRRLLLHEWHHAFPGGRFRTDRERTARPVTRSDTSRSR